MVRPLLGFCAAGALGMALANPAFGGPIQPLSQARSVSAWARAEEGGQMEVDTDSLDAPDAGPWVGSVFVAAEVPGALAGANALQHSLIEPFAIIICGEVTAGAASQSDPPAPPGTAEATAASSFDLTFFWPFAPSPCGHPAWQLEGTVEGEGADVLVRLSGPDGTIFETTETGTFSVDPDLPVGEIRLQVHIATAAAASDGVQVNRRVAYEVFGLVVFPPPPKIFACDVAPPECVVNSDDFFTFLTRFFTSPADADFNEDGVTDSNDFFDFLDCYFGG